MVTSIQLGTLFSSGGKFVLGGGNSGIDTEALITSLIDARRIPAVKLEDKVSANTEKLSSLSQLEDILTRFRDASGFLRNPPGAQNADKNIFEYRVASVGSNTAVPGTSYVLATAVPGTTVQNYSITEITSLARAKKQETGVIAGVAATSDQAVFAAAGAGQFQAGTVTINGTDITLEDGDTLAEVAFKFNQVQGDTGISASILQTAPGEFKLVFTATATGESADFDLTNGTLPTVTDPDGVFSQITFATTQDATNAVFKLDSTTIERESNQIDDLIEGVALTLKQVTPDASTVLDLRISPDTELAKQGIFNFVDSYNELRLFISSQTSRNDDGTVSEGATFVGNPFIRAIDSELANEISSPVLGLGSGVLASRLSDLGITFTDFPGNGEIPFTRNILTVDEDTLDGKLATEFDRVRSVFEFSYESSSTSLGVSQRTNALSISSFSLNIDQTGGIYQATFDSGGSPKTIDLDVSPLSGGSGIVLTGQDGTELEGLEMIFVSTADEVITVDITQGIGDRIYNALASYLTPDTGLVATEKSTTTDANTRYAAEIARIDAQIETYRISLLQRFASLEAALSSVNTILQSLDAQQRALEAG